MNEFLILASALVAGLSLGAIFFGGLWWSVRQCVSSKHPALWFLGSALVRMSLVLAGFYLIGREHWERLLLCLIGFVIARFLVMRFTSASFERSNSPAKEARHAP